MKCLQQFGSAAVTPQGVAYLLVRTIGERGSLNRQSVRKLLFDHLNLAEGQALCRILGYPDHSPSLTLDGIDFDTDSHNADMLTRWFDVSEEAVDTNFFASEGSRKAIAGHKLHPHQINGYQMLRRTISDSEKCVLVHMPCGAGKMRLVATAVLDLYRSEPDGKAIVWLAPSEVLCDEAFDELRLVWEQLGSRDITIYRIYGNRVVPDLDNLVNCIVVADITRLDQKTPGLKSLGERARVLILGDAELIGHSSSACIIKKMTDSGTFNIVAISASPGTVIDSGYFADAIRKEFGSIKIEMKDEFPRAQLCSIGNISSIDVRIEMVSSTPITVDPDLFDLSIANLELLSQDAVRNDALFKILLRESKLNEKTVFFAPTAEHARLFAGLLSLRGTKAMQITGELSPDQRARAITQFNARDDKILCIHGFFLSGGSVSKASMGVIAMPTLSEAVFNQMVGRFASDRENSSSVPLKIIIVDDQIPGFQRFINSLNIWNDLKEK